MNKFYSVIIVLFLSVVAVGSLAGVYVGVANLINRSVVVSSDSGAVDLGKVTSEVVKYQFRTAFDGDPAESGWMDTASLTPGETFVKIVELAYGEDFSYKATTAKDMVIGIRVRVAYEGTRGSAVKTIQEKHLVFHRGTTLESMLLDINVATKQGNELYKKEHSYLQ